MRVLIADDEALVRHALRIFVETDPEMEVVGEAFDGAMAVDLAMSLHPNVVLMDLQMPKMSGIEATERIVAAVPETRVIAVTTFSSEPRVVSALRAGASGYLVKDTEPDDIVRAIRDVHAGRSVISPRLTRELISSIRDHPLPGETHTTYDELTSRELAVVRLIARGMSNAEMAEQLHLAEPTVKATLGRVISKWGVRDRVQVLIRAINTGLVTVGPHDEVS